MTHVVSERNIEGMERETRNHRYFHIRVSQIRYRLVEDGDDKMKEKLRRFMAGRYGADQLSQCYSVVVLVMLVLSMVTRIGIFYWMGIGLMIYSTWRMFSKNVSARYQENQKYLNFRYGLAVKKDKWKKRWQQRKTYRFFKCPQCKQTVRVPKGRGKICITCPKCRTEFVKKS